jgi:hypothetical protein
VIGSRHPPGPSRRSGRCAGAGRRTGRKHTPESAHHVAGHAPRSPEHVALSPDRVKILLLALIDAKWSWVWSGCPACEGIEIETRGQRSACLGHEPDAIKAERYDEMLQWLAGSPPAGKEWRRPA